MLSFIALYNEYTTVEMEEQAGGCRSDHGGIFRSRLSTVIKYKLVDNLLEI